MRQNSLMNLEPSLTEQMALSQREKQIQLFDNMVKIMGDQTDMIGKKTTAFTPNPAGLK